MFRRSRQLILFGLGSGAGLFVDLVGFAVLTHVGVLPLLANAISSAVSISVVYALVTRYTFGHRATPRMYVIFCAWYAASIITVSSLIQLLSTVTDVEPAIWKLCSIPPSFFANYLFSSRVLFRSLKPSDGAAAPETQPE